MNKLLRIAKNCLYNPRNICLYFLQFLFFTKLGKVIPDRVHTSLLWFSHDMGYRLDLNNPLTYNEKLQWLKLYDHNPLYTQLADKYFVREYVEQKIGTKHLIPLIGVWDSFDNINFDDMPKKFVLKCTHDSGSVFICTNKEKFDLKTIEKKISRNMKRNYYLKGREWPYKNIKPRIIAEQFMIDDSGVELKDYKIFCFNGVARLVQVDFNRHTYHKRNLYTVGWEYINAEIKYPTDPNTIIPKPPLLNEMLKIAEILSEGIPHVRVDLYFAQNEIYFGEMTFYHGVGTEHFSSKELERKMGDWISLPKR